jgi:hypothetical protein
MDARATTSRSGLTEFVSHETVTNMLRDHVVEEVGRRLRKLGFKRKGNTWRREGDLGIEVFNIQGSQWGSGAFYLNLGVYLGAQEGNRHLFPRDPNWEPAESDCQLRKRIEHEKRSADEVFEEIRTWFATQNRSLEDRARPPASAPVRVKHKKFGTGTVLADYGEKVQVAFDDGSTRMLAKSFVEPAS